MRADRLISILMLLQTHGKLTAHQLAEKLDVSERTIYRDIEALSVSGVPVYAEHGPGGGIALLDNYRTQLTGLNEPEQQVLFMLLSASGPLDQLGARQELKSAVLKLTAALSGERETSEERVRQRFYLDWSWWFHAAEPVPHLATLQQAIWEDRRVRLQYRMYNFIPIDVVAEPYGLVAKAGLWYLVTGVEGGVRVLRVSWLIDAAPQSEHFTRPAGFDLAAFWAAWCQDYEQNQQAFVVTLRVSKALMPYLPLYFGSRVLEQISQAGPPDENGWLTLCLPFESYEAPRDRILGFGAAVEVLEPEALRAGVIDYARQIVNFYQGER